MNIYITFLELESSMIVFTTCLAFQLYPFPVIFNIFCFYFMIKLTYNKET